jgi:hypothetical protein
MTTQATTATVQTITPDMAQMMMALNIDHNRLVRKDRVRLYAAQMKNGAWRMTGEPIIFSNGKLIDGQHRLLACIDAQTPFVTLVVHNVEEDSFAYINSGLPRSLGDVVAHAGHSHSKVVAAAVRLVMAYEHNVMNYKQRIDLSMSREELLAEIDQSDGLYSRGAILGRKAFADGFTSAAVAAFHVLLSRRIGEHGAERFEQSTIDGVGLTMGDPRLALRRWVVNSGRTSPHHLAAWISAWNSYAKGEPRKIIKGWSVGDPFPRIFVPVSLDRQSA